jgi:hypothetical protein
LWRFPGEESFRFVPDQDSQEVSLGGGDQHVGRVSAVHPLHQGLEEAVGSHGGRSRFHDIPYETVPVGFGGSLAETADHLPVAVDHYAHFGRGSA